MIVKLQYAQHQAASQYEKIYEKNKLTMEENHEINSTQHSNYNTWSSSLNQDAIGPPVVFCHQ